MKIIRRIFSKICHSLLIGLAKFFPIKGHILMLHWIEDTNIVGDANQYRIPISQFKKLLIYLRSKNTIVLYNWEKENNFYALTIDDVPECFYYSAFPLLKEFQIPFTLFVNTSLLDQNGYITKDQLVEMSQSDLCTIGSHGVNHCEYSALNRRQLNREFSKSKTILESITEKEVNLFAFPYGSYYACGFFNKGLVLCEYKYAFGTVSCPITKPLLIGKRFLPRINVDNSYINSLK